MRRFIRAMVALFILSAANSARAQPALPIVHTWGDLQKAPKLTVTPVIGVKPAQVATQSATFQVGISDNKATTYSAVVLYFLGETGSKNPYSPEEWGDYWLRIDGKTGGADETGLNYGDSNRWKSAGTLFYGEAISFATPGDHVVELVQPSRLISLPSNDPTAKSALKPEDEPKVLARTLIHVKGEPDAVWSPFWDVQASVGGGATSDQDAAGDRYAIVPVNNPKGGACLPAPPRPRWYANLPPADFALPQLLPHETPGTHVSLKLEANSLVVTLDSQIVGFFPDDYVLTRWWLNGQPVALDRALQRPGQSRELKNGRPTSLLQFAAFHGLWRLPSLETEPMVWFTHVIHFDMTFKPEWLGAKKGDRIGVQMLFCPGGYFDVGSDRPMEFVEEFTDKKPVLPPTNFSQLSNKIEFVYSGDPLHPQQ